MRKLILLLLLINYYSFSFGAELNMDEFIQKVKTNSKDLKLAYHDLRLAKQDKKEALSLALPKIAGDLNYQKNWKSTYMYMDMSALGGEGQGKFKMSYDNEYTMNLGLQQTLFSFKVGNAIKAAKQYANLTSNLYDYQTDYIITEAKKLFSQALLLKKLYEVNLQAEENAYENYLTLKSKHQNGLCSQLELLQGEVNWKNLIPVRVESYRNYQLTLNEAKKLSGLPLESDLVLKGDLETYPLIENYEETAKIFNQRKDYIAREEEINLRKTAVKTQFSEHLPSLETSLSYRYHSQSNEWDFENDNKYLTSIVTLNIPIYTGGYTRARVNKAKIELEKAKINLAKTKDDILTEIQNLKLKLQESLDRIKAAEKTIKTAEKAFKVVEISSRNGLSTQLELKESRNSLNKARLNYYQAVFDYLSAYYDYELAIGDSPS